MATSHPLSTAQLRHALQLSEQIDTMQRQLQAILGGSNLALAKPGKAKAKVAGPARGGKRTMSAAGRARIAAAAKARWAKIKGQATSAKAVPAKASVKAAPKKKGGLTEEGRAKLAAAMKARWAAKKKGGPAPKTAALS